MASNPRGSLVQLEWLISIGSFSLLKKEKKTQSQPNNSESNNIMVKQKIVIVIEVLTHAESKSGLYLGYLCSLGFEHSLLELIMVLSSF